MPFSGQQWTEDSQVGRLADGNGDFEGNGIFSKLLLDVSPFCLDLVWPSLLIYRLVAWVYIVHDPLSFIVLSELYPLWIYNVFGLTFLALFFYKDVVVTSILD